MANQDDPFGINELFSGSNLPAVVNTYKPIDPMAEMAALVKERNAMDVLRSKQVEAQNRAAFDNELADKAMNFDVYKEKAIANIENKTGVKLIGKARTEFADGLYDEMYKSLKSDKRYAPLREHFTANTLKPSDMEAIQASTLKEKAKLDKKSGDGASLLRGAGDMALSFVQGASGGIKSLTDLAGADNAVSSGLDRFSKFLEKGKDDYTLARTKFHADAIKKAEDSGDLQAEASAYIAKLYDQSGDTLAQGVGSFVPTIIAGLATGGAGAAASLGMTAAKYAKLAPYIQKATMAAFSAAQGVGSVKGSQYEQTFNNAVANGFDESTAKIMAAKASEYSSNNAGQQVLGGVLGAVAGATGPIEGTIAKVFAKKGIETGVEKAATEAAKKGILSRTASGFATEGLTEGAQGAQERYAGNLGAISQGVLDPSKSMRGVVGQGLSEGIVGGAIGSGAGAINLGGGSAPLRPDATFETDNQPITPPSATLTPQQRADLRAEYATSPETAIKKYADLTGQTEVNATAKAEQDAALQAAYDDAVANNAPEDVIQQRLAELDASVNATPEAAIASLFEADISSQESVGENAPTVAVGTIATLPNVISNGKELPDTKILEHTVATLAKSDPQVLYGDGLKVGDAKDAAAIESKVRGAISVLEGILSGSPAYANYDAQGLSDVVAENAAILQSVHDAVQTSNATRKLAAKTQREVLATKAFNDKQKSLKDADVAARKQAGSAGKPMGKPQADPLQAMTTEQIQQELQSLKQNSKEGAPNETKTTEGGQPIVETAPAVDAKLSKEVNANNTRANADRADAGVDANVSSAVPTWMPILDTNVQPDAVRKGRDEKYGIDVELKEVKDGYQITTSDENQNPITVTHGLGGIYRNGEILNMEGDFVKPRTIVQFGTGISNPQNTPFKGKTRKDNEAVTQLVADLEFAQQTGNKELAKRLQNKLLDILYGKTSAVDVESTTGSRAVVPSSEKAVPEKAKADIAPKYKPVTEVNISDLKLSKDLPQFKDGANENGVVSKLEGKFDRALAAPIQVWRRKNGDLEVISGRHRLDLAKRSGEQSVPAQINNESDGFTLADAQVLDIILNVKDGRGKTTDYIKELSISDSAAKEDGLLQTAIGRDAFTIATKGSDETAGAAINGQIGITHAVSISQAAPNDSALQAVGLKYALKGESADKAANMIKAVASMGGVRDTTGDMFGFDDSGLKEAEAIATEATKRQRDISRQIAAVQGAAKNPVAAKALGVNVKDANAVLKKIEELKAFE